MTSRRGSRHLTGGALVLVVVAVSFLGEPVGAQTTPELALRAANRSAGDVVIVVPDAAAGKTLAVDAFAVNLGQRMAPVAVQRVTDQSLDLSVLIDVGSGSAEFEQVRGALAEFLLRMPTGARIRVADGGTTQQFTRDRPTALDQVAAIAPFSPTTTTAVGAARSDPLGRLLKEPTPADRHQVVLVVTDRSDLPVPPTTTAMVDVISLVGGGTATAVGQVAVASGGIALDVASPDGVLAATDAVASDLARRYLLHIDPITLATPGAQLTVTTTGASYSVELVDASSPTPSSPTTVPAAAPTKSVRIVRPTTMWTAPLIAMLAVVALAAGGVAAWSERRRRTRITLRPQRVDVRIVEASTPRVGVPGGAHECGRGDVGTNSMESRSSGSQQCDEVTR